MRISILFLLLLIGCTGRGEIVSVEGAIDNFEVTRLFKKDGCTIYRFYDGRHHYFTNCNGSTINTECVQTGKTQTCHSEENKTGN